MSVRMHAGPPLNTTHDDVATVTHDVAALITATRAVLRCCAAELLLSIVDYTCFGLAHSHASIRETLTGDWNDTPALRGLHLWLRRVVAHTVQAADGVLTSDRDTAVLAAFCRELVICSETPPAGLTVHSLATHGTPAGAAVFLSRISEWMVHSDRLRADEAAEMVRVIATVRELEWHPWIAVSTPAAAVALAGRLSAAALVSVDDATGAQRQPIRAMLERVYDVPTRITRATAVEDRPPFALPF